MRFPKWSPRYCHNVQKEAFTADLRTVTRVKITRFSMDWRSSFHESMVSAVKKLCSQWKLQGRRSNTIQMMTKAATGPRKSGTNITTAVPIGWVDFRSRMDDPICGRRWITQSLTWEMKLLIEYVLVTLPIQRITYRTRRLPPQRGSLEGTKWQAIFPPSSSSSSSFFLQDFRD